MIGELTQELVKELLEYDPETGIFKWKQRSEKWFKRQQDYKTWNNKFQGTVAGTIDKSNGYIRISIFKKLTYAHRLAFVYMCDVEPVEVDHLNHIRTDNRWQNLRDISHDENTRNVSVGIRGKFGVMGVSWYSTNGKWRAYIHENGFIHLGYFENFEDAVSARKEAEVKYGYHENHGRN